MKTDEPVKQILTIQIGQFNILGECINVKPVVLHGERVGEFVVHRGIESKSGQWVATHPGTGWAVITAPTKEVACWGARRLSSLGMDWDFTEPRAPYAWPDDVLKEIYAVVWLALKGEIA